MLSLCGDYIYYTHTNHIAPKSYATMYFNESSIQFKTITNLSPKQIKNKSKMITQITVSIISSSLSSTSLFLLYNVLIKINNIFNNKYIVFRIKIFLV